MRRARLLAAALALLAATPALAAKKPLGAGERIDLNRASVSQLMRLPGVGRKKAEAIAAQRARAPFQRLEDVLSVKGVSSGWLEKQRPHLAVGAPPASEKLASGKVPAPRRP
ncbi:ComEA family DNA-binding protein [Anaeromyxobacter diazotrophicus]|uniref:Helix-hairpin-helix domain-containing protein n=1 Tax=Anaeromyxobacter diazotrophicus TaxID=2590199 RepID=A0A7I9VKP8_9BACT|nr:helix-hairpin-helix domain-containing protein [Anaeromyxobacter diazotrophicus]GEJ56982.1 hypothetical protein AMYX_17230 [Anaeromyxobacter diazotrophicus]